MALKKRRQATAEEEDQSVAEPQQDVCETPVATKRRKKLRSSAAEEQVVEGVPEDACETPVATKRRKKMRPSAEEEQVEDVPEEAPTVKKTKKSRKIRAVAAAAAPNDDDEEQPPPQDAAPAASEAEMMDGRGGRAKKARRKACAEDQGQQHENEEIEIVPQAKSLNDLGAVRTNPDAGDKNAPCVDGEKIVGRPSAVNKSFAVFVGGIPWSVTKEGLQKDFEECGPVVKTELFTDKAGVSKGCALITFADEAGLRKALEFDGEEYGGRRLKVSAAESRSHQKGDGKGAKGGGKGKGKGPNEKFEIFVKNISSHTQESEFKGHFANCGAIAELSLPTRATGKSKGFGWITFATQEAFDKALSLNGSELKKFNLVVEQAGQHLAGRAGKGGGKGGKGKPSSEFEVFVSNLTYESNEAGVRKYFADCGEIARMHMPTKVEGKCMGFAWITFKSKEALRSAVDRAGEEFEGRRLKVEKSGQHREEKAEEANAAS